MVWKAAAQTEWRASSSSLSWRLSLGSTDDVRGQSNNLQMWSARVISTAHSKSFLNFEELCVCPRACACGKAAMSRFWELQTMDWTSKTVFGYLGKEHLGMCVWGMECGLLKQGPLASAFLFFWKGLFLNCWDSGKMPEASEENNRWRPVARDNIIKDPC